MKVEEARKVADTAIQQLAATLERGQSETLKAYLAAMAKFPRYSAHNVCLIMAQRPSATRVAGYTTWSRLGRQVKRGARGIRILAPVLRRRRECSSGSKGHSQRDDVLFFRGVCVFDCADTEGAPLPEPSCVDGNPGVYFARLTQAIADRGIRFAYSKAIAPAHGVSTRNRIVLRPDLAPAERFATATHELAHVLLGHHSRDGPATTRTVEETEAEAVAHVVCQAIGLDSTTASADYLTLYRGDAKTLAASLERIQRTAAEIIAAIGPDV